jgi:hypothetical protein
MIATLVHMALAAGQTAIPDTGVYNCEVQTILPAMQRMEGVSVRVAGDDWQFGKALAEFTGVELAQRKLVDGQPILIGPVAGDPVAKFEAKTGLSDDETRFVVDWTIRRPVADVDEAALVNSGLAVCDLQEERVARKEAK